MIGEYGSPPSSGQAALLPIDHIGLVVGDLDREASLWRDRGFAVSEAVPLIGDDGAPLGQRSAHVVFENAYVEITSPFPGSGNHLEPYLALGEGVRVVVLAVDDAELARSRLAELGRSPAPCAEASRLVLIDGETRTARFRWFALPAETAPGLLCAVVEHRTPELVFHPSLIEHPNGLRRIGGIHATRRG